MNAKLTADAKTQGACNQVCPFYDPCRYCPYRKCDPAPPFYPYYPWYPQPYYPWYPEYPTWYTTTPIIDNTDNSVQPVPGGQTISG